MRTVKPMRLVHTGRRWYLAAWDVDRADWRTFRVDRVQAQPRPAQGARFTPRQASEGFFDDGVAFDLGVPVPVSRAPADERVGIGRADSSSPWIGVVEPLDERRCVLTVGADSYESLAALILQAGADFTLLEPPELVQPIRAIAARLLGARAASCSEPAAFPRLTYSHMGIYKLPWLAPPRLRIPLTPSPNRGEERFLSSRRGTNVPWRNCRRAGVVNRPSRSIWGAARRRTGVRGGTGNRRCIAPTPSRCARSTNGAACFHIIGGVSCAESKHTRRKKDHDHESGAEQGTFNFEESTSRHHSRHVRLADRADGAAERNARRQTAPMVLEPRPGGRWYRELGGDNGHLWGFVQSIKRPGLFEFWGPLFISTGATSNLIYRLSELRRHAHHIRHSLVGPVPDDLRRPHGDRLDGMFAGAPSRPRRRHSMSIRHD